MADNNWAPLIPDPAEVGYQLCPRNGNGNMELKLNLWGQEFTNIEGEYLDEFISRMEGLLRTYESMAFQRDLDEGNYA